MSKNKGKDKKNDASSVLQKQFEAQKRELIDFQFTIKRLEQRLGERTIENEQLSRELEQVKQLDDEKIRVLNDRTQDDQKRLNSQINRITELEINATRYESQITSLKEELSFEKQQRNKEVADLKIRMESQRMKLDIQLRDLQVYAQSREKNEQEMFDLKQRIEFEKADKIRELADKEREKVQATDKLRDEMLKKIRDMRSNLLSLKKEQLSTTTRLTILQNHQLTSELEYQSKQTEKLIFKEEEMSNKIKKLTQEVAIHRQVEEQLAKRSHFSKGVIKKLNDRVTELEEELKDLKESGQNAKATKAGNKQGSNSNSKPFSSRNTSELKSRILDQQDSKLENNNKEIAGELERQLEVVEKKYMDLQSKFQAQKKEKDGLASQLKKYENSTNQLTKMLIIHSEQILGQKQMQLEAKQLDKENKDEVMRVDLATLRGRNVEQWSHEEVSLVTKILINLVRPYITKKNVMIPAIRRLLALEDSKQNFGSSSEPKLPKLLGQIDENGVKGLRNLPINVASKIVSSNLRQWGTTVMISQGQGQKTNPLRRKYKISQSHR